MSTPAVIGLRKPDNTIEAIYLHWDGYPSHTGKYPRKYYRMDDIIYLLNDIIFDKISKKIKYGTSYEYYMERNLRTSRDEKGFWTKSVIIKSTDIEERLFRISSGSY